MTSGRLFYTLTRSEYAELCGPAKTTDVWRSIGNVRGFDPTTAMLEPSDTGMIFSAIPVDVPQHSDEKILNSDATLGEFYAVVEPVMKFLNEHFDPHTRVIIDTTNAEILSGLATHHTMKFVKD